MSDEKRGEMQSGICRMGADAGSPVVDPNGRSHEIGNLWIAGNSIFPSALPANPGLTIMALALRSAEAFFKQQIHTAQAKLRPY